GVGLLFVHQIQGGGGVFFFQAEDGIRDKLVTGVQTCALPIWSASQLDREPAPPPVRPWSMGYWTPWGNPKLPLSDIDWQALTHRSEERRVGKECRSRWARRD